MSFEASVPRDRAHSAGPNSERPRLRLPLGDDGSDPDRWLTGPQIFNDGAQHYGHQIWNPIERVQCPSFALYPNGGTLLDQEEKVEARRSNSHPIAPDLCLLVLGITSQARHAGNK